jgi:hypothetical protein
LRQEADELRDAKNEIAWARQQEVDDCGGSRLELTLYHSLVTPLHSGGHVAAKRRDSVSRRARQASGLP